MRIIFYLLVCIVIAGCISAKGKVFGSGVVTPYGTANSINGELEINAYQ